MTPFKEAIKVTGVTTVELRVRRAGTGPAQMAKLAFVDPSMNLWTQTIFSGWSTRSQKLLDALLESIESDFIDLITPEGAGPVEDDEEDENAVQNDSLDFG